MKGVAAKTQLIAVSVILAVILLGLTMNYLDTIDDKEKLETLPIVDNRIESTVYMASGLKNARIQLNLRDTYGLNQNKGIKYINYSTNATMLAGGSHRTRELNAPADFTLNDEGRNNKFCIHKTQNSLSISPEAC